jgi:hypothetical protein
VALVWLVVFLVAAAPAAAAPIRLEPASGEAGARVTLRAAGLPARSPVEVRVAGGEVRIFTTDARGRLTARRRIPRGARGRVRVALQNAGGGRVVMHYRVRSRWSDFRSTSAGDWRGRVLRVAAELELGKLVALARVRGLRPRTEVAARYGRRRVARAAAGARGRVAIRLVLPQSAAGRPLTVTGRGIRLAAPLPTPPAVVAAAADVACKPPYETGVNRCRHAETAALAARLRPDAVVLAGDLQYQEGRLSEFRASFDPTWGRLRAPLRPTPGNHEYRTPGAADYFAYFAAQARWRPPPWYAYDLGPWRLFALNSNCEPGRVECGEGSVQESWLRANLAAERRRCTLAYWHHPRFSSGFHGSDTRTAALWRALDDAGAELVISGHDHHYERFRAQDADGLDDSAGMRQFVAGTGGSHPSQIRRPLAPHSERRQNRHFGVMLLRLYEDAYSWRFVALGGRVLDFGNGSCQ